MNAALMRGLVPDNYAQQGCEALAKRQKQIASLLSERRLPAHGWDTASIQHLLQELAAMDSNNFIGAAGVGEREARVACPLVAARHYGLAHGIGRSGNVAAPQPKAAGSSLLQRLTCLLATDALRLAGLPEVGTVTVLPVATGLAMTMTLLALRTTLTNSDARHVLWPRIDQKTCLKAVVSAGFEPVPVTNQLEGDEVRTDIAALEAGIARLGAGSVAAVVTTASCFAPRGPDRLVDVAKLCKRHGIAHIVNNAYGVQSAALCRLVTAACRKGRVDAIVQSTDKNFMVPVGGAIVAAPRGSTRLVEAVNEVYPGRASASPSLDLFMTLLHWGASGWQEALRQREALFPVLLSRLREFAACNGERVLDTPSNPISIGVTLQRLSGSARPAASDSGNASMLGSMLFNRSVSGARVVVPGTQQQIAGHSFAGYGAHIDSYPVPYLTAAAALGTTEADVNQFLNKLESCYRKLAAQGAGATGQQG